MKPGRGPTAIRVVVFDSRTIEWPTPASSRARGAIGSRPPAIPSKPAGFSLHAVLQQEEGLARNRQGRAPRFAAVRRVSFAVANALSAELAASIECPDLPLDLPSSARLLAGEARANTRLARAVRAIRDRLRMDARLVGATAHFRWSLQVADRPTRTAVSIARYASWPTIADLAAMPPEGLSGAPLRLRAFRRRLTANLTAA